MTTIRVELPGDSAMIRSVNERAFGRPAEADLVDELRSACPQGLSLVAEDDSIVGHVLFTPVLAPRAPDLAAMGLGPLAVSPERQRRGIGTALVDSGLGMLRARGCPFVIVLGEPAFYSRFGFVPASRYDLTPQWPNVPDEAFMVLVLERKVMDGVSGVVRYRDEFDSAM